MQIDQAQAMPEVFKEQQEGHCGWKRWGRGEGDEEKCQVSNSEDIVFSLSGGETSDNLDKSNII